MEKKIKKKREIKTEIINGKEYVLPTKELRDIMKMDELLERAENSPDLKKIKIILKGAQKQNTKMFMKEMKRMGCI